MGWSRWYATKSYLGSALWIVPLIALVLVSVRKLCESFESVKGRGLSGSNYL